MDVLLSTTFGVYQDSIGEREGLVTAAYNALTSQQTGRLFNNMTLRVLLCELIIMYSGILGLAMYFVL